MKTNQTKDFDLRQANSVLYQLSRNVSRERVDAETDLISAGAFHGNHELQPAILRKISCRCSAARPDCGTRPLRAGRSRRWQMTSHINVNCSSFTELKCRYRSAQSLSTGRICHVLATLQKFRRS